MELENRFDEKTHTYYIDGKPATGVTTIIGVLAKPALIGWAAKMAVEHIKENAPGISRRMGIQTDEIRDIEYYRVAPELLEEARTAHTKKKEAAGTHGTDAHALVERYIKTEIMTRSATRSTPIPVPMPMAEMEAIKPFIDWAQENVDHFLFSERRMFNKELFIAGTCDFAYVDKKGRRMMADYKTSGGIWGVDYFLQVAAYKMLAEAEGDEPYVGMTIVRQGKKGLSDFEVQHLFDYETFKEAFLSCLTIYRAQRAIKDVVIKEV